jgi:ubiquinone/menaquinone biosynthesis C-methylase UbiE
MTEAHAAEVERLLPVLRELDRRADEKWRASLERRKREEADFHDVSHSWESVEDPDKGFANKKYYSTTKLSHDYLDAWIAEHARGKVFLDYACGAGGECLKAARAGAALAVGLDISPGSVAVARRRAEQGGAANTFFLVGDCEDTGLPADTFDAVLCSGMLHHLDLSYAFPELRRILKPGGVVLAFEALNYNPAIKLYRRLTPHLRTSWEKDHILSMKEVRFASYFFEVRSVKFWHLCSILATPLRKTRLFPYALAAANLVDRAVLSVYPLSRLAWMFTFELVKKKGG